MHRTLSVDYSVVLAGELVTLLDGGEEKTIKAGDIVVQRGTNHQLLNRSDTICRILVVMVGAEEIMLENGNKLSV